jgi:ABC-type nitrate/sulfonate/bicarbonate transport system substrate-binding protein
LPDYPGGVFAAGRKWADENRAVLVRYLRVWNEALRWAHEDKNRDAAIKHIAEAEQLDEKNAANRLRQLPQSGRLNLPGLQSVLDLRVQFGLVPPLGKDLARYYEENFYRESSK